MFFYFFFNFFTNKKILLGRSFFKEKSCDFFFNKSSAMPLACFGRSESLPFFFLGCLKKCFFKNKVVIVSLFSQKINFALLPLSLLLGFFSVISVFLNIKNKALLRSLFFFLSKKKKYFFFLDREVRADFIKFLIVSKVVFFNFYTPGVVVPFISSIVYLRYIFFIRNIILWLNQIKKTLIIFLKPKHPFHYLNISSLIRCFTATFFFFISF